MAVTLAQAAVLSENDLQRGVIETFVQESPVLDRLPLLTIQGNAYAYNVEATLPGVAFRGVNEAYVESTGTVNQRTETLAILGGDADVDRFIVQTLGNLNDQRAIQTRAKVKASSIKFQDSFINGDVAVDAKSFDGLKKRLTGAQVIDAGVNGLGPVAGGHDFFDALDALMAAVPGGPDVLYANSKVRQRILSAGRRIGGADLIVDDIGGRRTPAWNGVPVYDLGQNPAGGDILGLNETQGTATTASSIYAVKFGEAEGDQAVTGLTNGGVQVYDLGELQDKPAYRTRVEFYCGLAVFGGAARLRGVLNA
jgi:hypothetical protein